MSIFARAAALPTLQNRGSKVLLTLASDLADRIFIERECKGFRKRKGNSIFGVRGGREVGAAAKHQPAINFTPGEVPYSQVGLGPIIQFPKHQEITCFIVN